MNNLNNSKNKIIWEPSNKNHLNKSFDNYKPKNETLSEKFDNSLKWKFVFGFLFFIVFIWKRQNQ